LLVPEDVAEAGDRAPGFGGPHPALPESLGGGEILVEVNEEEVGDEFWVSHGEAKLAAELLAGVYPLPPAVRESLV
jgi:hypothetical protein